MRDEYDWEGLYALTRERRLQRAAGQLPNAIFAHLVRAAQGRVEVAEGPPAPMTRYHYPAQRSNVEAQTNKAARTAERKKARREIAEKLRRWPAQYPRANAPNRRQTRHPRDMGRFWLIMDAQRGRCFLCGHEFTAADWATDEHVKPRGKGGRDSGNVLLAHLGCNNFKGDRDPHPCELLFLEVVNLTPGIDLGPGWMKRARRRAFVPLRARLAAVAAE